MGQSKARTIEKFTLEIALKLLTASQHSFCVFVSFRSFRFIKLHNFCGRRRRGRRGRASAVRRLQTAERRGAAAVAAETKIEDFKLKAPNESQPNPEHALRTPHASRLAPHALRPTPHASLLTPHASRLTPRASPVPKPVVTNLWLLK